MAVDILFVTTPTGGICRGCGAVIAAGSRVAYYRSDRATYHTSCATERRSV